MPARWTLNRAGIINVYQYDNETLEFAGGRLLLRGVNGSGKSTAMNMLLPFLLEADTRRIDAAGEQSSILKSWMLSGRDDPQPSGYLWIEFAGPGGYLVCGCGIRANRSSGTVNTWWFITTRRPGVDLALVESRTPLSTDSLKAALGNDGMVFRHDQRGAYRAEVRRRLFNGADLDQHIRLLHVVRNPRVGDRIDEDLAGYLAEALPQLSDNALDDAAQPLEDLEEHRSNVHDLGRTTETLSALRTLYADYARNDLHRRAAATLAVFDDVQRQRRAAAEAIRSRESTATAEQAVTAEVALLVQQRSTITEEISALTDLPAYREGLELDQLREHVEQLGVLARRAEADDERARIRRSAAAAAMTTAGREMVSEHTQLGDRLAELSTVSATLRIHPAPDVPALGSSVAPLRGDLLLPEEAALGGGAAFDATSTRALLAAVRASVDARGLDVAAITTALDHIDRLEALLHVAEDRAEQAGTDVISARTSVNEAEVALASRTAQWSTDVGLWCASVDLLPDAPAMTALQASHPIGDLSGLRALLLTTIEHMADQQSSVVAEHRQQVATISAECTERKAVVAELASRTLPATPLLHWQIPVTEKAPTEKAPTEKAPTVLADLIDFHDHVNHLDRAGIEAAMEAAGLLGATIGSTGIALATGELVLAVGATAQTAGDPLHAYLRVAAVDGSSTDSLLAALLSSITTDLTNRAAPMLISTDGTFRLGALTGRHAKADAEHIGVTARRAALDRARREADEALSAHLVLLAESEALLQSAQVLLLSFRAQRSQLPDLRPVDRASLARDNAHLQLRNATEAEQRCIAKVREHDIAHSSALSDVRRRAATLGLGVDRPGLTSTKAGLTEARDLCTQVTSALREVERSCDAHRDSLRRWEVALQDHAEAVVRFAEHRDEYQRQASRLATLEDSLGATYDDLLLTLSQCRTDLAAAEVAHSRASTSLGDAIRAAGTALAAADIAEHARLGAEVRGAAELPVLRAALAVNGLLDAAMWIPRDAPAATGDASNEPTSSPFVPADIVAVEASSDGARALATMIHQRVPVARDASVTADSVRRSLRARRDQLGAGWDAEDRQGDEALPVAVEVTGPMGHLTLHDATEAVKDQFRTQSNLLTAKQEHALRNLLQGLIAREVAEKLHAAADLVTLMNRRLGSVRTSHGIGATLRWRRKDDLDSALVEVIDLLAMTPDLRTREQDQTLATALSARIDAERAARQVPYRELIGDVLDYRRWHDMTVMLHRPGTNDERLTRRTKLSEGEKKVVSYLALFAAVAASCDALAEQAPEMPRFVLLDDAFAKVSEDNHPRLFGLMVELDLDFIATSERLWGTHATVPELMITEVIRDAELGVIVLEHARWDGRTLSLDGV